MRLALAGDTMLGRQVGERLATVSPTELFDPQVVELAREADLFVVNLECAISDRGQRWADPTKAFFFRAPPVAAEVLTHLGVDCVTLANNHALDFGAVALVDTMDHLAAAGIAWVGAGADQDAARSPQVLERAGLRIGIVGVADHPAPYAAGPHRPGIAYGDLRGGVPEWLRHTVSNMDTDVVLVTPHWGPNMVTAPLPHVRAAGAALLGAGATLVAGHSAHVCHGVAPGLLYDLGDFIDDYATDPVLRNDLSLLFLVDFDQAAVVRIEAVPLALEYCHTRLARGLEAAWITRRFTSACAALGTVVTERSGRLIIDWPWP